MDDEFAARIAAYDERQADLEEMHAAYEEMDQAEYAEFMDEMDARDAARG
jgi:hypothetical protein